MSPLFVPLLLVAAGAIALFARYNRAAIVGMLLQWAGLAAAGAYSGGKLSLNRTALAEAGTALSCTAIFWLTLNFLERKNGQTGRERAPVSPSDYFLPGAVLLLGGMAGVGLAVLFPLGSQPEVDLALYWALVAGALLLILEAARNPVMLAAGLFALLNSGALLLHTLDTTPTDVGVTALAALVRIGIALVLAFLWIVLADRYGELSLEPLFNTRSGETSMALVAVDPTLFTPEDPYSESAPEVVQSTISEDGEEASEPSQEPLP